MNHVEKKLSVPCPQKYHSQALLRNEDKNILRGDRVHPSFHT